VGTTKTSLSAQRIPLIQTAKALADAWREACGNPSEGFLFQNSKGEPIAITAVTRPIKVILGKRWKGLYSARRGIATTLTDTSGNALGTQGLLRHKNLSTTHQFYVREMPEETVKGMKAIEDKISEARAAKK
jgi:site-specific recombinase XerC